MPSHSVHRAVSKLVLGKPYEQIHMLLDLPAFFIPKGHRRFFHDPVSAYFIGYALDGEKGGEAALLHIIVDQVCTDKRVGRLFRKVFR
jgi:hypothetical protein